MPISEKRSATDGAMVVFKKPRTEVVSYADHQETTVSYFHIFYLHFYFSRPQVINHQALLNVPLP